MSFILLCEFDNSARLHCLVLFCRRTWHSMTLICGALQEHLLTYLLTSLLGHVIWLDEGTVCMSLS